MFLNVTQIPCTKGVLYFVCVEMKPLEGIVGDSSISFRTFTELKDYIRSKIKEGRKPIIAIELTGHSKFIAFHVRELKQNTNRTYRPVSEGYIYDCSLPNGFFSPNGEGSYNIDSYPVDISYRTFRRHGVFIIEPETNLGKYIQISMDHGRINAHVFWRQLQEKPVPQ